MIHIHGHAPNKFLAESSLRYLSTLVKVKQKDTPLYKPIEHVRLNTQIAEVTEDLEELKSEKTRLINRIGLADDEGVKRSKARIETHRDNLRKAETAEIRATVDLEDAAEEYHKLEARASEFDPDELMDARLALRPEEESRAASILKENYTCCVLHKNP